MTDVETKAPSRSASRRSSLRVDLTILGVVGLMLIAALTAGGITLYQQFYGPSAFVVRYLDLLAEGRAADALRVPGVAIDRETLAEAGLAGTASEAMLRKAALAPLTDIEVVGEEQTDAGTAVTVGYSAGGHAGRTTFVVEQDGWAGVTPNWRFSNTPLAVIDMIVRGSDRFAVNGFEVNRAQVTPAGEQVDPLAPVPLLVFTPGLYSVTVDTAISTAGNTGVLADTPLAATTLDVQTAPTPEFIEVVQEQVAQFLTACATQEVLQPTACPFGLRVDNRLASVPKWSIVQQPTVSVEPDGANWQIPATDAVAHITVDVQSLFDGSIDEVSEDVPFQVNGTITILADGSASIRVGAPGEE